MALIFDSAAVRNPGSTTSPAAFGFGVSKLDHTPTPLADILAAYHFHPARIKPYAKPTRHTTADEAWDLGYRLTREYPNALPPAGYDDKLRAAFLAGAEAAKRAN